MSSTKIYYYYVNAQTGLPYFYEPNAGTSVYTRPTDGLILDPDTKRQHMFYDDVTVDDDDDESPFMSLDAPEQVEHFVDIDMKDIFNEKADDPIANRTTSFMPASDGGPAYLPNDLKNDIQKFQITEFAKQFFREHRGNHNFKRKRISVEALTSFSAELLTEPLLEAIDQKLAKFAIQSFKYILNYTGVGAAKNPASYVDKLMPILYTNPALRDETMFQLIKQTRDNPNPDWLKKTWELFVIVVTVFPSSRNSENWIKSHFFTESKSANETVSQFASFAYIRFSARCALGKPMDTSSNLGFYQKIPNQVLLGRQIFGSSLYEQIWNQRRSMRKLPIPFVLHHFADTLLKLGCEKAEGIFRLPGNLKRVDEIAEAMNVGQDTISKADINDVASLMKKWFRDLPDPIVNLSVVDMLETAFEDKTYIEFTEKMQKTHRLTLMYLVGFLQHLVKSAKETKMTAKNYAIVFAPNIVQIRDSNEPNKLKKFADISIDFLTNLIETWDTSYIYPPSKDFFE